MEWWWLAGALVLGGLLAWRIVRAYNVLSLNYSLCRTAWHQLDRTLAMRHTLVGALLLLGSDRPDVRHALVEAQRLERRRAGAAERHPVEMLLLSTTRNITGPEIAGDESRTILEQLVTTNGWVASGARYYNHNIDLYLRRRRSPMAVFFRAKFPAMDRFHWPNDLGREEESDGYATGENPGDDAINEADNPEGYRPMSIANLLRRRSEQRRDDSLGA